jgi:hypothetical protein
MTDRDAFDLRFAAAIRDHVGHVWSDLDPVELAHRIAVREPRRQRFVPALALRSVTVPSRVWVLLLLAALLTGLVGGISPTASPQTIQSVVVSTGRYMAVSTGGGHTCAIRTNGTLECWGRNLSGQASPPDGTYRAVSAGGNHTCAIRTDGTLACWGGNPDGQTAPPLGGTYAAVDAGSWHTCAIRTDGTLECWGLNSAGETTVPAGKYRAVSAGQTRTCAIRTDGTLTCWGFEVADRPSPLAGAYVSVDTQQGCAIREGGTLACWGPEAVTPPLGSYVAVVGDWGGPCALRIDGTLTCWGPEPGPPPPPGSYTALSSSLPDYEACAIRTDGRLTCWGRDWIAATDMGGNWMGPPTDLIPALGDLFTASEAPSQERGTVEVGVSVSGCSVIQPSTTFSLGDTIHVVGHLEREPRTDERVTLWLSSDDGLVGRSESRTFDPPGGCLTGLLYRAYVAPPWTNLSAFPIDWPVGHYSVDFYAGGTPLAHGEFDVRS